MHVAENTVSTATQAAWIFSMEEEAYNRRRKRSAEPGKAVSLQFERVYDMVGSEAFVLCDERGAKLTGVGDGQLCRLLAQSVPAIAAGDAKKDVQLKAMDVLRPNIDWSNIAVRPIALPNKQRRLYVASVSESQFNQAGVLHAGDGVKRILGIPSHLRAPQQHIVSSRDRLAFDVSKAIQIGYHDFLSSALAIDLRVPRRSGPRKGEYVKALCTMLDRVQQRLQREGLSVDKPSVLGSLFRRGEERMEGYRTHHFELPVRRDVSGRRLGTLVVEMTGYVRQFAIPEPPVAVLYLG